MLIMSFLLTLKQIRIELSKKLNIDRYENKGFSIVLGSVDILPGV